MGWICALVLFFASAPAGATTVSAALYFPLEAGNSWTYLENGVDTVTETVLPGVEIVRGISTVVVARTGGSASGSTENLTNDASGLRLHKQFLPGPDGLTIVYRTPLLLMPATATVMQSFGSSGIADISFPGMGTFPFNYQTTGTLTGTAWISVPMGSFETVRLDSTLTMSGSVFGQLISITGNDVTWLTLGIGAVKVNSSADGIVVIDELVATNVPEPGVAALRLAGLAALVALAAVRRRAGHTPT